ncbi:MAG: bile acid:sodium symporter family protein [Arcanobacterium sp.]|nr:bile acid:sodium symporter family protein [Arcanobacterium sp.]
MPFKIDPLLIAVITAFVLGLTVPTSDAALATISTIAMFGVAGVFLAYGLRIQSIEVIRGLADWKLQSAIFATTFVIFPVLGITLHYGFGHFMENPFLSGVLFLTLLPSTVQASVSFTSVAGGDIARAVCAATISNISGILLTPLLMLLVMQVEGSISGGIRNITLQLLVPFIIGQCFQPFVGKFFRRHRWITKSTDTFAIALVVFSSVLSATKAGIWHQVSTANIIFTIAIAVFLLGTILFFTWKLGKVLKQPYESVIPLMMCGSTKSLSTGLPIAIAIFPAAQIAPMIVPVIIYHQVQSLTCALIAGRLGQKLETKNQTDKN